MRINKNVRHFCTNTVIYVLALIIFVWEPIPSYSSQISTENININLKLQQQSLSQSLGAIAEQIDIAISLTGTPPQSMESINLENVSLDEAIDRLMKLYGITNHAAIYDLEEKKILLTIIQSAGTGRKQAREIIRQVQNDDSDTILTGTQIAQLKATNDDSNNTPLSSEQKMYLEQKAFEYEYKVSEKTQILNSEKVQILRSKNLEANIQDKKENLALTNKQLELLKRKKRDQELLMPKSSKLTTDQILKLKKGDDNL